MTDVPPDNLSGSHLQSQVNGVCQSMMLYMLTVIGQLSHDGIGCKACVKVNNGHGQI